MATFSDFAEKLKSMEMLILQVDLISRIAQYNQRFKMYRDT